MARLRIAAALVGLAVAGVPGCGDEAEPVDCVRGRGEYMGALFDAMACNPGEICSVPRPWAAPLLGGNMFLGGCQLVTPAGASALDAIIARYGVCSFPVDADSCPPPLACDVPSGMPSGHCPRG